MSRELSKRLAELHDTSLEYLRLEVNNLWLWYKDLEARRPRIMCLLGSTRFTDQMLVKQWELTKRGYIVLSWCALPDWYYSGDEKAHIGDQEGVKAIVDEGHLRKIDLADEVLVINVGGYIGESTRNEIRYAESLGKTVNYLEVLK